MGLGRRAAALAQVAGRAGRRHIFPCRAAAKRARDDVIEGEVVVRSAILAAEAVAKEEVEPGEGGMRGGTDILAKRDDRRQPHGAAGLWISRSYSAMISTRSRNAALMAVCQGHRLKG